MASVGNATCARFDRVASSGGHHQQEAPFLFVKGTWLPSEFTISVCDGNDAWTGRASREFVLNKASELGMTESEYVDSIQYYFSKQQPNARYELRWGQRPGPEVLCSKILPHALILRLETTADSGPGVATDMVQFLLEAYHHTNEELARKTRGYERALAAKDLELSSLRKELEQERGLPKDLRNGPVHVAPLDVGLTTAEGMPSQSKRKAGCSSSEARARKRAAKSLEARPGPSSIVPLLDNVAEPALGSRPPPLSELGYKQQPKAREEREPSKEPSWLGKAEAKNNGVTDDSGSDVDPLAQTGFLDRLSDVALLDEAGVATVTKKRSEKKHRKSGASGKSVKIPRSRPALEDPAEQVEDVVEMGIKCVDSIAVLRMSSPLTTPAKQQRDKTPAAAKKQSKSSSKPRKDSTSGSRKKGKAVAVDSEAESSDGEYVEAILALPAPGAEEDRAITVQSAEFHDFDDSRSEAAFEEGQFWALYDDQDGMPRFYGRVRAVQNEPFQVTLEWLEPFKPNLPLNWLVKTAGLSASCGEFTLGSQCTQALPAFSHEIQVGKDSKKALITIWPEKDEIWALYRHYDKKQAKREGGEEEYYYDYDLVKVVYQSSLADGVAVIPLVKVDGFRSLFVVAAEEQTYRVPHKHVQAMFSHCIPKHEMLGSESPGVPIGAWELDPASTPSEYLGIHRTEQGAASSEVK